MPKTAKKKPTGSDAAVQADDQLMASNSKQIELTKEGLEELTRELQELKEKKLPQVIDRVAKAREYGDLSENSEYHSARDEQQLIEARIEEVEYNLANAKIVKATKSHDKVGIGSVVTLVQDGKKGDFEVTIVGEFESTPGQSKISSVSPMGKALMGKKKGDSATVKAPAGEMVYTIKSIK